MTGRSSVLAGLIAAAAVPLLLAGVLAGVFVGLPLAYAAVILEPIEQPTPATCGASSARGVPGWETPGRRRGRG